MAGHDADGRKSKADGRSPATRAAFGPRGATSSARCRIFPFDAEARRRGHRRSAFTLIELLLILALVALTGAILLPSAKGLFPKTGVENPDDIVSEVMQKARREAVLTGREVVLRFEVKEQRFAWSSAGTDEEAEPSVPSRQRPVGELAAATSAGARYQPWTGPKVTIEFLRPHGGNAILLGGRLVETATVPMVRFFPDGTCDPVRLQIRPASGNPRIVSIDPWTCALGLEVKS